MPAIYDDKIKPSRLIDVPPSYIANGKSIHTRLKGSTIFYRIESDLFYIFTPLEMWRTSFRRIIWLRVLTHSLASRYTAIQSFRNFVIFRQRTIKRSRLAAWL